MAGPEQTRSALDPETRKEVVGGIYKEIMLRNGTITMEEGSATYTHPVFKTPHILFGESCEGIVYSVIEPKNDNTFNYAESACDHCTKTLQITATFTREELEKKKEEDSLKAKAFEKLGGVITPRRIHSEPAP